MNFNRQDVTEDNLRLLFSNTGGTVKAFKFFQYVDLYLRVGRLYLCPVHSEVFKLFSYVSGIVKWLWSRCPQWRKPPRPWSTSTTTTWEAASTWESPSPSPLFKCLRHRLLDWGGTGWKLFRLCLDTGGTTSIESVLLLMICCSCHSLRETETFFFKKTILDSLSSSLTVPLYFLWHRNDWLFWCISALI